MKNITKLLLVAILAISLFGCSGGDSTANHAKIISEAEVLDWKDVYSTVQKNKARAEDYNGNWYIYTAKVSRIEQDFCYMTNEFDSSGFGVNQIWVFLSKDELKTLNPGDTITVVGRMESIATFATLSDAFIYDGE